MGSLNPFTTPKMPAPQIIQAPVAGEDTAALEADRKRRALAQGSTGNIASSLSGAVSDAGTTSRKTLLGG
jgi:hypothetical protein